MVEKIKKISGGLLKTPADKRDFSYTKVFGAIPLAELPEEDFMVAEAIKVENQKESDFCTAYGSSSVSEDQEDIDLDPLYTFAKTKQIMGDWKGWGADLRTAMKAGVKFGFLEKKDSLYTIDDERDKISNWNNWPVELDEKAAPYRKHSYFKVDGPYNTFDSFRAFLWANRAKKQSILTGVMWRSEWIEAKNGIIPNFPSVPMFGHAFKICGQKTIEHELYLVAVLSNGEEIGDKGIFYFNRLVANRDFTYGGYVFNDMMAAEAKKKSWNWYQKILGIIQSFLKQQNTSDNIGMAWMNKFL